MVDGGGGGCRLNALLVAASLQLLPSSPVVTPSRRLNVLSHSCTRLSCHALAFIRYSSDGQPSLPLHRDACTLSFNVLLCSPRDFVGGGTRLESLGVTIRPDRIGDVFMHSGQMLHGGKQKKITRSTHSKNRLPPFAVDSAHGYGCACACAYTQWARRLTLQRRRSNVSGSITTESRVLLTKTLRIQRLDWTCGQLHLENR